MASKMVSFVFKVLIMTVLIMMITSFAACMIDIFVTTTRIQSLAQMMQYDIAQNNCLLNDTYEGFKDELYEISSRSSYMKVCCDGDEAYARANYNYTADMTNNAIISGSPAIELYLDEGGAAASQRYIQRTDTQQGVLVDSNTDVISNTEFAVANYGDILTMHINTCVNPRMFAIGTGDNAGTIANAGYFAMGAQGGNALTLNFVIPALTYIK